MYSTVYANLMGIITLLLTPGFTSESGIQIEWRRRDMDNDKELKLYAIRKNYVGERNQRVINDSFAKSQLEQRQNDFNDAENFGILAANEFFEIEEPKLFKLGIFLKSNEPASYLGAFNRQTDEAKHISKVAYAALKASKKLIEKYGNGTNRISPSDLERDSATLWSDQHIGLRQRCPRRDSPHCPTASLKYRTADGTCNNREHPWWGSAMSTMQRLLPPVYDNGVDSIRRSVNRGKALPSPRDVSTIIHEDKDVSLASITHMLMQWGQFVDHDMTATAQSQGFNGTFPQCCRRGGTDFQSPELTHPDCLPIPVSPQDSFFGPLGVRCLEFVRSSPAPREDCGFGPREQLSQVTSYIDGSMIYSSHPGHSDSLRIFRGGLLQYGKLRTRRPQQFRAESDDICRRGSLLPSCFRPGDARLSENPALTSLHVVFLRTHNDIATELSQLNSHWSDEKIFQETRKIVGALIQHITYHEFLPIVVGPEVMKIFELELLRSGYYNGYDSTVNPDIANSFSTAAYRFGHSLAQEKFFRYDNQHHLISNNVSMHEEFGNRQDLHSPGSVDRLLLGLVNQPAQRRDECITKELTNHLFQFPNARFGMDLAAINIQRGRDHGLPPYIKWREPCGLSKLLDWQDLERAIPSSVVRKMQFVYSSIEDIDLFTGGLSEKSVLGGLVGPTFACIIAQQFSNAKKGDRFWYENGMQPNSFTPTQLHQIRRTTLAQILCRVLDNVHSIQRFVFLTSDIFGNEIMSCNNPKLGQWNFQAWIDKTRSSEKIVSSSAITIDGNIYNYVNNTRQIAEQGKTFGNKKLKPVQTNVHQKNRIIVKRPVGTSHDNVTIVVNNHAVNSPIFVNDAIYGSNFHTVPPSIPISTVPPSLLPPPASISNNDEMNEEIYYSITKHHPTRPTHSSDSSNSYIPIPLQDPNNPNSPQRPIVPPTTEQPTNYPQVQSNHRHDAWVNIGPLLDQLKPDWYTPLGHQPTSNYELRVHTREKASKTNAQYEVPMPLLQYNVHNTDKNNNHRDNLNSDDDADDNDAMITEKDSASDENIFKLWSDSTIINNKNLNRESDEIPKPIKLKNKRT